MSEDKDITPNNKEFVVLSVEGYQKLAGIDTSTGKDLYWTTDMDTEIPIKMKLQKNNGHDLLIPKTIPQLFLDNAKNYTDWPSVHAETKKGKWTFWTWGECWDTSFKFARATVAAGISPRSCVNIIGFNCQEWFWIFHGTIMADCIAAGVYTTNNPEACQYVAEHSSCELICVEDEIQLEKYLQILPTLPLVKKIVNWGVDRYETRPHECVMGWQEFLELADQDSNSSDTVKERIENQVPGKCCSIVYTSGTTGNPKGVMLTHDNLHFAIEELIRNFAKTGIEDGRERLVSYLPLSHSAAQVTDILNNLFIRAQIYFARPDALQGTLVDTLIYAKPTIFMGVPRVWEKMEERLKEIGAQSPGIVQKISTWAKSKGTLHSDSKMHGTPKPFGYSLAHFLILGRIKKALGLDECRFHIVTAAPLKTATKDYFKSLDMPMINVYGMSECSGPATISIPGKFKDNTVGYSLDENDLKIDKRDKTEGGEEDEGEICWRGRNNFIGYLNNAEKTRETLDANGYIHSGDIGTKDSEGFVKVTGRIKELIITAGGENVAPVLIEDTLKDICPIISNVMVIGDDKKFLSALVTFKVEVDNSKGLNTPTKQLAPNVLTFLADELDIHDVKTTDEAINNDKIKAYIQSQIEETNKKAISRAQHIRKHMFLATDFSMEGGELTPTLKLKRSVAVQKYADVIAKMYPEEELTAKI